MRGVYEIINTLPQYAPLYPKMKYDAQSSLPLHLN
jgi:hypothetical protein